MAGAKQAAENGLDLTVARREILQGLKPEMVLQQLRHDPLRRIMPRHKARFEGVF